MDMAVRQSALAAQEKRLSRTVLQNIASKQSHADFKPTVLAIYAIVEDKLYKELCEFQVQPTRERLCRALKRIANSPDGRRILWKTVLEKTQGDESLITTATLTNVWADLVKRNLVQPATIANDDDGSDDDDSLVSQHVIVPHQNLMPQQTHVWSDLPLDIQAAVNAIKKLEAQGMRLEVFIDGNWLGNIRDWRFRSSGYYPATSSNPPVQTSLPQQQQQQRSHVHQQVPSGTTSNGYANFGLPAFPSSGVNVSIAPRLPAVTQINTAAQLCLQTSLPSAGTGSSSQTPSDVGSFSLPLPAHQSLVMDVKEQHAQYKNTTKRCDIGSLLN